MNIIDCFDKIGRFELQALNFFMKLDFFKPIIMTNISYY
jgi:hypothetical protein